MSNEIVNTRNIAALAESAKQERARADALIQRVTKLESIVTMLRNEVSSLRVQLVTMLTANASRGPTSRGDT